MKMTLGVFKLQYLSFKLNSKVRTVLKSWEWADFQKVLLFSHKSHRMLLTPFYWMKHFPQFQFPLFERSLLVHLNISFCQRQEIILLHILNLPHSGTLCNWNSGYAKKETLVVQSGKWFQVFLLGNTSLFTEHHVWSNLKQRVNFWNIFYNRGSVYFFFNF